MKQWNYKIHGRVQGVGYRNSVCNFIQGGNLSLKGFVKNHQDGTVIIVAQGEVAELKSLEQFCHKGSPMAKVTRVEVEEVDGPQESFQEFSVKF